MKTICPYCGVGCGLYLGVRGNRIVVADTGHNQVKVLSDTGELIAVYTGPNDGVYGGPFNEPRDVAIDGNGRIVVVDTGNSRIVGVIHDEPRPGTAACAPPRRAPLRRRVGWP